MTFLLLFIIFFVYCFLAYVLNSFDVLSPWLIAVVVFSMSTFVAFLSRHTWDFTLHYNTVFFLCFVFLIWGIGEVLSKFPYNNKISKYDYKNIKQIKISDKIFICFLIIESFTLILQFIYMYRISLLAGNGAGISGMFKYARYAVVNVKYNASPPTYLAQLVLLTEGIGYNALAALLYNKIMVDRSVKNTKLYMLIGLFVVLIAISTARIKFIHLIVTVLMLFFIMWKKKNGWNNKNDGKIVKYALLGIVLFLIVFRLLGYLTDKSGNRELWGDISLYTGGSIYVFDHYLNNYNFVNDFFGKETLYNLYAELYKFHMTDILPYNSTLPFVYFAGTRANVFTAFRRLFQDYGYIGMSIILLIQSFVFGRCLNHIKYKKTSMLFILLFACFFYIVAEISIDEQFITTITAINTIFRVIYIWIAYKIMFKDKRAI